MFEEDGKSILRNMRGDYQDLGDAYMFKEGVPYKNSIEYKQCCIS